MSRIFSSFRSKLIVTYLLTVTISAVLLACIIARYFSNVFLEQNVTLAGNTLNAVSQNINTYLDDLNRISILPYMDNELLDAFHTYASANLASTDDYTLLQAERKIRASFQLSLDTNRNEVNSILIVYPGGEADYFNRYTEVSVKSGYSFSDQKWFQPIIAANGSAAFIDMHPEDYLEKPLDGDVFSIGRLIKDPDSQEGLVAIVSNINNKSIDNILNTDNFGESSYILIQDAQGNLVYSPQTVAMELQKQIFACTGSTMTYEGVKYAKLVKHVGNTDWNINVLMPYYPAGNNIALAKITITVSILFEILFASILFYIWSNSITRRFSEIRTVMQTAKNGDFSARYTSRGKDEIAVVGSDLNDMIARISDLMEKERSAILKMKSAEYSALQSQINPHFIYNILNGFVGLNRLGKRAALEEAILALSHMMRYILEHQESATLAEEMELITRYCNLQRLRFGDRLQTDIFLDESVRSFSIPKLLVQPLVENAILHGIEPLNRKGSLRVSAKPESDGEKRFLVICVQDDGVGFSPDALSGGAGLGMRNVRERLALAFANASLVLTSAPGAGTRAVISVEMDAVEPAGK